MKASPFITALSDRDKSSQISLMTTALNYGAFGSLIPHPPPLNILPYLDILLDEPFPKPN